MSVNLLQDIHFTDEQLWSNFQNYWTQGNYIAALNLLNQKVITIRPGSIKTPLSDGSLIDTEKLANKTILYKSQAYKFLKLTKKFMGKVIEPEKVGKLIVKTIEKKRTKYVYKINRNFLLSILNLLPKRLQCFIIKTILK